MASLRLAHVNLLWSDEDYHLAAAIQILHGRVPYRDFWYDKPPLAALFYSVIGGYSGWPLRLLDVGFVLTCCWFAFRLAKACWGEREGLMAALLLAFFTTFYLPSATIPFAVDALLLLPQLAAVSFAQQRRAFWSGLWCAAGLLTNVKAVFVAATCAVWLWADLPLFASGLILLLGAAGGVGAYLHALAAFYNQVWDWGLLYTRDAAASSNLFEIGLKRSGNWLAFHGALVAGIIVMARHSGKDERFKLSVWFLLSAAALLLGNHFAPRYFFQLLPVIVIVGARGLVLTLERQGRSTGALVALLLLAPLLRFGPRYLELAWDNLKHQQTHWSDAAMDLDSQQVARLINGMKRPDATLFVWGYRPDVYVYTRLIPPGKFWDSQPLDGVPADRHLQSSEAADSGAARMNRLQVIQTRPTFIVDGLSLLNAGLAPKRFPEIAAWLGTYRLVGQTRLSRIYASRPAF
jgi:hypothetical protein